MDPLKYDFAQRGPAITQGCLEPLYEMKALFVPVRSPQWNCEESANDEGIYFPTHECNEDLRSLNRQNAKNNTVERQDVASYSK